MTFPECEPHSGSGLGVRAAETHTEEGGGDQGGRSVQDPAAAAGQTRQVCFFFCFFCQQYHMFLFSVILKQQRNLWNIFFLFL